MPTTVGATTDTARVATPRWAGLVLDLLVVPLIGLLALVEQLARLQVAGGLGVVEPAGQRVVLARPQVVGQVLVGDAPGLRLFAAVPHAPLVPTPTRCASDQGEALLAAGEVVVAAAYGVSQVLA